VQVGITTLSGGYSLAATATHGGGYEHQRQRLERVDHQQSRQLLIDAQAQRVGKTLAGVYARLRGHTTVHASHVSGETAARRMGPSSENGGVGKRTRQRESSRLLVFVALTPIALASCYQATPAQNGLVEVANRSTSPASIHWRSPGLLGSDVLSGAGTEPIAACGGYVRAFGSGHQTITITSASATGSFALDAPSGTGQATLWVVIRPDGRIDQVTGSEAVASPYCP